MQPSRAPIPNPRRPEDFQEPQATPRGPSWGLMIFLIVLAIVVAFAIAWAFVTPLLHRHF